MRKSDLRRRDFLAQSATGVGTIALLAFADGCKQRTFNSVKSDNSTAASGGKLRVRRSWHTLSAAEQELYKKAVDRLNKETTDVVGGGKAFPKGAPYTTQFQRLAFIHLNSCPHQNWFFLPWHRNYLALYESELIRVLGAEAGDFALPYWDWTTNPAVMPEFYEKTSPLNPEFLHKGTDYAIQREVPSGFVLDDNSVGQGTLQRILGTTDFYAFASYPSDDTNGDGDERSAGGLEGTPHNYVHGTLRGNMGSFLSPMDPIFWLHHCNVDRLWSVWMRNQPNVLPYVPQQDSFSYRTRNGNVVVSLVVKDASGNKSTDYAQYWLDHEFRLNAGGTDGMPDDFLHQGTKTKDVVDSTTFILSGRPTASAFRYDTDPEVTPPVVKNFLTAPRPKRIISSVDFNVSQRAVSSTTFSAKITSADSKDILAKFAEALTAGKDAGAFIVISNVPVPDDAAVRDAVQIRLRAADADTRDAANVRGDLRTYSFFQHKGTGDHAAHAKPLVTISVEVTQFLKGLGGKATPENLWISGAFELKKGVAQPANWEAFRTGLKDKLLATKEGIELTLVVRTEA